MHRMLPYKQYIGNFSELDINALSDDEVDAIISHAENAKQVELKRQADIQAENEKLKQKQAEQEEKNRQLEMQAKLARQKQEQAERAEALAKEQAIQAEKEAQQKIIEAGQARIKTEAELNQPKNPDLIDDANLGDVWKVIFNQGDRYSYCTISLLKNDDYENIVSKDDDFDKVISLLKQVYELGKIGAKVEFN